MAGYGKIGTENQLMSSQVQHDTSWVPLSGFVLDGDGNYYEYYLTPSQPDMDKLIADAKKDQVIAIVTEHVVFMFDAWEVEDLEEYTKRRTDVNARISEIQGIVSPTQDELDELMQYNFFFDYDKSLNSQDYGFKQEVLALGTLQEVEDYTWQYESYAHTMVQPYSDAEFFVKYGFEQP